MVCQLHKKGQPIFILMIFLTLLISVPFQPALAALLETETVINPDHVKDTRVLLNQLMAREDVRMALLSYGINLVEADARVAAMTDDEICTVANTMKEMPAGGMDPMTTLAVVTFASLILAIFLVISLTSLGVYAGIKASEQIEQKKQEYSKSAPFEPWTGSWKVDSRSYGGVWVLKQVGSSVVSTEDSATRVEGKVDGNIFYGIVDQKYQIRLIISPDNLYFSAVDVMTNLYGKKLP